MKLKSQMTAEELAQWNASVARRKAHEDALASQPVQATVTRNWTSEDVIRAANAAGTDVMVAWDLLGIK